MMPAIGNRNVQASVVLDRDLDHLARIRRLRHIRRDEGDIACYIRERIAQRRQPIGVDVRENKTRALAGEQFCRCTAYPGCSTCDRSTLAAQASRNVSGRCLCHRLSFLSLRPGTLTRAASYRGRRSKSSAGRSANPHL
jgi:hypothetical protein